jgi:hypothetical protein
VMNFRHRPTGRRKRLLQLLRSLLVMSDEARYEWEHGIAPPKRSSSPGPAPAGLSRWCRTRDGKFGADARFVPYAGNRSRPSEVRSCIERRGY